MTSLVGLSLVDVVRSAVDAVADPELAGVSIGSLGLVRSVLAPSTDEPGRIEIVLTPTFLGCPALAMIANDVRNAALAAGATDVSVTFDASTPWTTATISPTGRAQLGALGVAVATDGEVVCPFCGSAALGPVAAVGPTSCRSVKWCSDCRNIVEVMHDHRRGRGDTVALPLPTRRGSYAHV
jgi:ring-1,2-phenylacetyl-CoA epoxidase subunit PaaD